MVLFLSLLIFFIISFNNYFLLIIIILYIYIMCCLFYLFYFHLYIDRDKTCKFYDSDICVVGRVFSLLTKELL